MAYDANFPANDSFLADFPPGMREQIRALVQDMLVNAGLLKGLTPGNASGNIPVSNGTLCTGLNAEKLNGKLASEFAAYVHSHAVATSSSNGFMSNTDFTKLAGISAGAQVNQNAWSNFLVSGVTAQADSVTDTFEFIAGTNVALTLDTTNDRLTIGLTGKVASATAADSATTATTATTAGACTGNSATATSASNLTGGTITGDMVVPTGNRNTGIFGTYDSTKTQHIWSMGTAYKNAADGSSFGNLYGLAYKYNAQAGGHGVYFVNNGTAYCGLGLNLWAAGNAIIAGTISEGGTNLSAKYLGISAKAASAAAADTATTTTKLATARTIALTGAVTGSGSFDGSGNLSITTNTGTAASIIATGSGSNYYWRKWSNGDIEQWFYLTTKWDVSNSATLNATFPVAFPTACKFVIPTSNYYTGDATGAQNQISVLLPLGTTSITIFPTENGNAAQAITYGFYAIGN